MKKLLSQIYLCVFLNFLFTTVKAQSDVSGAAGHSGLLGYYCGWDGATNIPLEIRHNNNRQIRFFTNAFQRMVIDNGGSIPGGSIGFGNLLPIGFTPLSRLHSAITTSTVNDLRFTNASTSVGGFSVGISGGPVPTAELRNREFSPMVFYTDNIFRAQILNNGRAVFTPNVASGTAPLILGAALDAHFTIRAGNANGVLGTTSNGLNPRIYFETSNTAAVDHGLSHSVPVGPVTQATSGIIWDNIVFSSTPQSDFHINSRTTLPSPITGRNVFSITQNSGQVGIFNTNPQNRLEITSIPTVDPQPAGLRFTNLTSTSATVPNPGLGVLAVDGLGDVIYVDASGLGSVTANNGATINPTGNVQWGQINTGTGALSGGELIHDTEIPFNNFDVFFPEPTTPNLTGNSINIGTSIPNSSTRLNVVKNTFSNSFGTSNIAIAGSFSAGNNMTVPNNNTLVGVLASASSGVQVQSITGIIARANGTSSVRNTGVDSRTNGSGENFGIFTTASGGTLNYALYASVSTIDPIPSLPPTTGSYAGYFNGTVLKTGADNFTSDLNLKTNVDTLSSALNLINQLQPRSFYFDTTNANGIVFSGKKQYGFIAQDIEPILPEIVGSAFHPATYDSTGSIIYPSTSYKTLQYNSFIAILTKGIQEQQQIIEELNTKVASLENCISNLNLCEPSFTSSYENKSGKVQNVELKDVKSLVLEQNVPNPFAEMTTISYELTEGVQRAQMLFYNATGKLINSMDLSNTSGKGQLNVFANDLSNGIYTYTLVVDGKIIDSKRMVKQK